MCRVRTSSVPTRPQEPQDREDYTVCGFSMACLSHTVASSCSLQMSILRLNLSLASCLGTGPVCPLACEWKNIAREELSHPDPSPGMCSLVGAAQMLATASSCLPGLPAACLALHPLRSPARAGCLVLTPPLMSVVLPTVGAPAREQ